MNSNNTINLARLGMLGQQYVIHHYRILLTSIVAFCGGLFMLLLLIQFSDEFRPVGSDSMFHEILVTILIGTAIICGGTAFPSFRSKEKTVNYLMLPASATEKFLIEFLTRTLLFVVVTPLLYWFIYNLEGYTVNIFYPTFSFTGQNLFELVDMDMDTETARRRVLFLIPAAAFLLFTLPFTGATIFMKNALVKTLFSVAIIFFFNLFLVYFFLEILAFKEFHPSGSILFIRHAEDMLTAMTVACIILNIGLISAAYFKLKEKEV
jgi:hypothetical protein